MSINPNVNLYINVTLENVAIALYACGYFGCKVKKE